MSKHGKVIKRRIIKDEGTDQMNSMFNQMLGNERPDYSVIYPKYQTLVSVLNTIKSLFDKFKKSPITTLFPEYSDSIDKVSAYSIHIDQLINEFREPEKPQLNAGADIWKNYTDTVADIYIKLKSHASVRNLVILCSVLDNYKKYIGDSNKLSAEFILTSAEPDLLLLHPISNLPFKPMFLSDKFQNAKGAKQYTLMYLNMILVETKKIYDIMRSPDVDVDKFVSIVVGSIDKLRNHPELRNCDEAFNKIKNATSMLKDNFDSYYGDFATSGNPTIIMELFVTDVSRKTKGSAKTLRQFRRIVSFYQKNSQGKMQNNPQLASIFKIVGGHLDKLEKSDDMKKEENEDDDGDDNSSEHEQNDEEDDAPELIPSETVAVSSSSSEVSTVSSNSSVSYIQEDDEFQMGITKNTKKDVKKSSQKK